MLMKWTRGLQSLLLLLIVWAAPALAQDARREIEFPDVADYQTLKCDFHMHTVFSDGQVWPTVRVAEAWRQGLDAISITDHIEHQPHKDDVPTAHNRPYELAEGAARQAGILLIRGTEITRDTPPGHFNALFLSDVEPVATEDLLAAMEAVNKQGGFVFWNHHAWKGEERGVWMDIHQTMLDRELLHAMEVANGETYYPTAHNWCLEKGLTMIGTSDIHAPDLREQTTAENHRTMTLVLAKDRSIDGVKEALEAGRTIVWFKEQLIGREEFLRPFFDACLEIPPPNHRTPKSVYAVLRNASAAEIVLERRGRVGPQEIRLPPQSSRVITINTQKPDAPITLRYTATNFVVAPEKSLDVEITIPAP
ncbi:MAG: Sb-PDE family phosphodiesterase [Planctomycetota bacterium]